MRRKHLQQRERSTEIVLVVLQGNLCGFADSLQRRKVNRGIERSLSRNDLVELLLITDVRLVELNGPARDLLHPLEGLLRRIAEVVDHDNIVSGVEKLHTRMAADESGTACHKNLHVSPIYLLDGKQLNPQPSAVNRNLI